MSRTTITIHLSACEQALLQHIIRRRNVAAYTKRRVQTILAAATGLPIKDIVPLVGFSRDAVSKWRTRWATQHEQWQHSDVTLRPPLTESLVLQWLDDKKGRGRKMRITDEQRAKVAGLSLDTPEQHGIPVTHWTLKSLAVISKQRGIVDTISRSTVYRILKKTTCLRTGADTG